MKAFLKIIIIPILVILSNNLFASNQKVITFTDSSKSFLIGKYLSILEDTSGKLTIDDIIKSSDFRENNSEVPNLGLNSSSFWIKFTVQNNSSNDFLLLDIAYPLLDVV